MPATTIDQIILNWFNTDFGTNFSGGIVGNILAIALAFFMTIVLAGIIGYEREYHGHNAGLRTHILIALGSALIMTISIYGFRVWDASASSSAAGSNRDPARLAAQVITGIGFLGAGAIVQNGISVRGLTTATTIWMCMAIGLCCGSGNYVIATAATLIAMVALINLRRVEKFASKKNPILTIVFSSDSNCLKDILATATRYGITLHNTSTEIVNYQDQSALRMSCRLSYRTQANVLPFVEELRGTIRPLEINVSTIS